MLNVFLSLLLVCLTGCGAGEPAARVVRPQGTVQVKAAPQATYQPAKDQDPIATGGAIKTGASSSANLLIVDRGEITIQADSSFEVGTGEQLGAQTQGTVFYRIRKGNGKVTVDTPHGVTAVLGTTFRLLVTARATTITVEEGRVGFTAKSGGEQRVIEAGKELAIDAAGGIVPIDPLPELNPGLLHPK